MNMGEDPRPWVRRLLRPPGWPLHSLTAIAILLSAWAAAAPMASGRIGAIVIDLWRQFGPGRRAATSRWRLLASYEALEIRYLYAFLAWGVVLLIWWSRRVLRGVTFWRFARRAPAKFAYWRRWLATLILLAATTLLCMTPAPVYLGFWLSKSALEKEIGAGPVPGWTSYPPMPPAGDSVKWVGIYPVGAMPGTSSAIPDQVWVSPRGGFVYFPAGDLNAGMGDHFKAMGGGWYRFEMDAIRWW
jgi:hypothetical protein